MTTIRHAEDFTLDELRQYVRRARASTAQRLLEEELASERPRAGAVELLEARLEALGAPLAGEAVAPPEVPAETEPAAVAPAGPSAQTPAVAVPADVSQPQEEAQQPLKQAAGRAGDTVQAAADQARDVTGQAQERAQDVVSNAQDRLKSQVDERFGQVAAQVGSAAEALRRLSQELSGEGQKWAATLADQGAEKADQLAAYLEDLDVDAAVQNLGDFARRQPIAVVATGVAIGFAVSRAIKAARGGGSENDAEYAATPETVDVVEGEPEAAGYEPEPIEEGRPPAEPGGVTPGQRARARAYSSPETGV